MVAMDKQPSLSCWSIIYSFKKFIKLVPVGLGPWRSDVNDIKLFFVVSDTFEQ